MRSRPLKLILLYLVTVIADVILLFADVSIGTIFIINFVVILVGYVVVLTISNQRFVNILEEDCDPERFLEECEKKKKFSRRAAYQNVCNVNVAVGLMALGRSNEALEILGDIDMNIKNSRMFKTAYHLSLFSVYINTDKLDKATDQYENHLKELRNGLQDARFIFSVDASVLDYHYRLNKSKETARLYLEQLDYLQKTCSKKVKKRQKLGVIYNKAQLLTELGEHEEAAKKFETVVKHGNSLWIAKKSKEVLLNGTQS